MDANSFGAGSARDGRVLALVQWSGPVRPEGLERARALGGQVGPYVPDGAYLVAIEPARLRDLRRSPGVRWMGPLPDDRKYAAPWVNRSEPTLRLIVLSLTEEVAGELRGQGRAVTSARFSAAGWHETRLALPPGEIPAVAAFWDVFHIEIEPEYRLLGERAAQTAAGNYPPGGTAPSGPGYVAWLASHGLNGAPARIVQVQDDGLDRGDASNAPGTAHPDILGRIVGIRNATADLLGDSRGGHGQVNAGIVMGNATVGRTDGAGFLLGQGVAPQALIYATKIFRNSGPFDIGNQTFSSLARDASQAGARFSNNSWGADVNGAYTADSAEFDALTRDADAAEPGHQSMVYVFAAGNRGPGLRTLATPATGKNVIAVGATENSDADGTDRCGIGPAEADNIRDLARFSSRGPTTDDRIGVTVVAVGTHVQGPTSTAPDYLGNEVCDAFWPANQTDYARSSGTSHSTPVVTGALMVIDEFFERRLALLGHVARPSPALLRAALTNTATDLAGGSDGAGGALSSAPNAVQGWGSVNLSNLFEMREALFTLDQEVTFTASGQAWEQLLIPLDTSRPLKITLAWTDPPANPAATVALVNDLDLIVDGPTGTYRGNRFAGGISVTGGPADRLHNLEAVFIPNPSGVYTIRVEAANIAGDALPGIGGPMEQDFAVFAWNATDQSSAGFVRIERSFVNCADSFDVLVSDADLRGAGSTTVSLSTSVGDSELLTLLESAPTSGVFVGRIDTAVGGPALDGLLQVADGGTITATYQDSDDGTGSTAIATSVATVDCRPPAIAGLTLAELGTDHFTVEFTTEEPATAVLRGGRNCGDEDFAVRGLSGTTHRLTAGDLQECSSYLWAIEVVDRAGNVTVEANGGACHRATTLVFEEIFADDFEPEPLAGWTHAARLGNDDWDVVSDPNAASPTQVFAFRPSQPGLSDARLISPLVQGGGRLEFMHTFEIETNFDGAVLEISVDDGVSWSDLGPFILEGGYTGVISRDFESPIAGQPAWTGGVLGPMRRVRVDLSPFTSQVRLAFRFAADNSVLSRAWMIDDVRVGAFQTCVAEAGTLRLDRQRYACSGRMVLEVRDLNAQEPSLFVSVTTAAGDSEEVLLSDPDGNNLFVGELAIGGSGEAVMTDDGRLQGKTGDKIAAVYVDSDDGSGASRDVVVEATLDCLPPVISDLVLEQVSFDGFTVSFKTDEPTQATVEVGAACGESAFVGLSDFAVQHLVAVGGLQACESYFFRVRAADAAGNVALEDNQGACYRVATLELAPIFADDFEGPDQGWAHERLGGTPAVRDNWTLASDRRASGERAWHSGPTASGSGDTALVSPAIVLPSGGDRVLLRFNHFYQFDDCGDPFRGRDGGVVEARIAGETAWRAIEPVEGYPALIFDACSPGAPPNPLAGREAYTHGSGGVFQPAAFDLTPFVGGAVQVRFRVGWDCNNCRSEEGWFIDDVRLDALKACVSPQGTATFDRAIYACGDPATVVVRDLNGPPGQVGVTLRTGAGDVETLALDDPQAINVYVGSIILASLGGAGAIPGDGTLQGFPNDQLTVIYEDQDTGEGAGATVASTALLDCVPPVISQVHVRGLTPHELTLGFVTNEPAVGRLQGGRSCGAGALVAEGPLGRNHALRVFDLSECTTYRFRLLAVDRAGNVAVDDDGGRCHAVKTLTFGEEEFFDDFEDGARPGWTTFVVGAFNQWAVRASSDAHSGQFVYSFAPGPATTNDARLITPPLTGGGELSFWHAFDLETNLDGAVLEISKDGGGTWVDLGPWIREGGYNASIRTGFSNPIAGQPAWTGVLGPPMRFVRVDLSAFPGPVRVAFRLASDISIGSVGWGIDDVRVRTYEPCLRNAAAFWELYD